MFSTACTLEQLKKAVDNWIDKLGKDTLVGTIGNGINNKKIFLDDIFMEWQIVDKNTWEIIGSEANDDEMKMDKTTQLSVITIK